MEYINEKDLYYINHKYHDPEKEFNPFRRYMFHGYEYDPATGFDDAQMQEGLKALFSEIKQESHPIIKAKCFAYILDHMRIDVNPCDYFVGLYNWGRPLNFIQQQWKKEAMPDTSPLAQVCAEFNKSGAVALWPDFDHVIPDWDSLLRLGFPGLMARAEAARKEKEANGPLTDAQRDFYDAIKIEFSAILRLLDRLAQYAAEHPSEKSKKIIACLKNLRNGAPQTMYDALQAIFLFFMLCEHVDNYQTRSLGNGLDQTLYPFYCKDIEGGICTQEELKVYLAYFLMQYASIANYWGHPFYLAGTDSEGNTKVNALSYDILEVHEALGIYNPKIQIKVNLNTPVDFLNRIFRRIRNGDGSFVFCCEPGHLKAVKSYGATDEEAQNFELSGCYETRIKYDESVPAVGYVNATKAVMLVFENGYDSITDKIIGKQTGALENFTTFDAFHKAFLTQWNHLIDLSLEIGSKLYDPNLAVVNPSIMYSATNHRSVTDAVDGYAYGCKYNNSALLNCGFATAVDSLLAVKELVYDKKVITLSELKRALDQNWVGYEKLRMQIRNSPLKYGNGNQDADQYAAVLAAHFADRVNSAPNGRGGRYKAIMHTARMFIEQGKKLGATPDGRLAGEETSKNASPSVGMDRKGVTALLKSAVTLNPPSYPESFCVDIMLHPSAVQGEDGLVVMKGLLDTYIKNDGMSIQFNVFNPDMLRDAQQNPEKYQNLQVRVCGWNVLWNNMVKSEQDAYILRSENICQ